MVTKLLPCPFCGETRVSLNEPTEEWPRGSINCPACLAMIPAAIGGPHRVEELIASWNSRTAFEDSTREECAQIADAYAEENLRMAHDTLMLDPCLTKRDFSPEAIKKAERLTIEGGVHSAMFHAAQHIAAAIRALEQGVKT